MNPSRRPPKSTQIQHWIWEEEQVRLDKNGQPVLDDRGKLVKDLVRLQRPKVIAAAVFNAQQIDGIPALEPIRELRWDAIEQAEKLLMASNARIEHSQVGGAYYRLSADTIHLPARERFASAGDYYSTALHELGHWSFTSRKHGSFHVIGAASGAAALQKIASSPVVVITEGYATAATIAKNANVAAIAAFDSGNLLAVATALRERYKDKPIIIAGDDDHRLENNPGRMKAIEAAAAVKGLAVFPNLSAEQRGQGFTDFNDLAREDAHLAKRQLEEAVWSVRQQVEQQTVEIGMPRLDSRAGREAGIGLATG
jgi:Zincin-like metallopeptidase/Toprim domain